MAQHISLLYDGSFEGFLTCFFDAFRLNLQPGQISRESQYTADLFSEPLQIHADSGKSLRIWNALHERVGPAKASMVQLAFLSEIPGIELDLFHFLRNVFVDESGEYSNQILDPLVHKLIQSARKVQQEAHRFQGFVRFEKSPEGLFQARIDPVHHIIDILAPHFVRRYPNQPWLLLDTTRKIGIQYDGHKTEAFLLEEDPVGIPAPTSEAQPQPLDAMTDLWVRYYKSVNIAERKNHRQMLRFMPRKYWKYLPEKQC